MYISARSKHVWPDGFPKTPTTCASITLWKLSAILAKSGPLDFATRNSFPLFFVCEKGLVQKPLCLFSNSSFLLCYKPKTNFARNGVSGGDRKAEIYGSWEARYGQLNAAYEILLWPSNWGRPTKFTDKMWKKLINFWARQVKLKNLPRAFARLPKFRRHFRGTQNSGFHR